MKQHTYTLENFYNSDIAEGAEYVQVTITEEDYQVIAGHAQYLRDHGLHCMEKLDDRCKFLDKVPRCFEQEGSRMQIFHDFIAFTGYEKESGLHTEWSTQPLDLEQIKKDLNALDTDN